MATRSSERGDPDFRRRRHAREPLAWIADKAIAALNDELSHKGINVVIKQVRKAEDAEVQKGVVLNKTIVADDVAQSYDLSAIMRPIRLGAATLANLQKAWP